MEKGLLQHFMVSLRGARKSGLTPNGRSHATNLWLGAGQDKVSALLAGIKEGFYVTGIMGRGYNSLTGDLSYSVSGFPIRDGEITDGYVVSAALAGTLQQILLSAVPADDLQMRYDINSPTLRVEGLSITGA
jgi:PmbA protein